jgi:hypothetical protein
VCDEEGCPAGETEWTAPPRHVETVGEVDGGLAAALRLAVVD